ncbi:hypothetical protein [Salinivibrio sp. IB282]|uniref:hypothetical protein n=1 Tax=Salinivibrio sp. IB282 TaxID=1766122 RepID=UPI001301592A
MLAKRHAVYQQAKTKHPERRAKETRDWTPFSSVTLNPSSSADNQRGGQKSTD